jgi:DNA primase
MEEKNWVDFKAVKAAVTIEQVLGHYGVNWLRKNEDELRGRCPIHQGDGDRTFHASVSKNAFHCFSCKARGNVLDFVAAMEHCSVRDAALKLQEWFQLSVGESGAVKASASTGGKKTTPEKQTPINPPLGFQLRVDQSHEYGTSRGVSREVLEYFGAGLCISKGTFAGRFIVPLHDQLGQLVGYAGRSIDGKEPKYLFPSGEKGFHKSHLLFNLHRVVKEVEGDQPVVVVEGFFDCMKVKQAGYPCVALMGSSLSEQQEEMLCLEFGRVVLMFDGDTAGKAATEDSARRLVRRMFVKAVHLLDGQQPDQLPAEEFRRLLRT